MGARSHKRFCGYVWGLTATERLRWPIGTPHLCEREKDHHGPCRCGCGVTEGWS